jgi:hypothetical protein
MRVVYSKHLETRLSIRGIEYDLPRVVFEKAEERFEDTATGHEIAVSKADLHGRDREVMVAYTSREGHVKLLTIHPLKKGQKENRISSGRWRRK